MKTIKTILLILMGCLVISMPCQAATKQIKFKVTVTYKIQKGEKLKLYVKGHKKSKKVKWKSSNKKIATVSKKGVVTGKKGGTCKITAKVGKKKYKVKIFVLAGERTVYEHDASPEPSSNRYDTDFAILNTTEKNLFIGQAFALKVNGTKRKITWKSSNTKVATVSGNGYVEAKGEGKAVITASYKDSKYVYELECDITVNPLWMAEKALEKTGLSFSKLPNTNILHITGQTEKDSLSGICKSYNLIEIPENPKTNIIYGSELRYIWNGSEFLFNTNDMRSLELIINK